MTLSETSKERDEHKENDKNIIKSINAQEIPSLPQLISLK